MHRILVRFQLLIIEMWRTYQQYLVAQKTLAVIVAPLMLLFALFSQFNYSWFPATTIFFYAAKMLLFIWILAMVPLGVYGAKWEKSFCLYIVICGLVMLISISIAEIVLADKLHNNYALYVIMCKSFILIQ